MPRPYDRTRRAAAAAQTTERVLDAAEALLLAGRPADLTLDALAAEAGITVQTVLRHFGSRQGVIDAVKARVLARVDLQRGGTPPGDVDAALAALLTHYEAEGRLVLALLSHEGSDPLAAESAAAGRAYHRAWVERCFGPALRPGDAVQLDALLAATDLYVWKLLRLDLARSPDATLATLRRLVHAVLEAPCPPS